MRLGRVLVVSIALLAAAASSAQAAFPGANGRIAFTRQLTSGVSQIFTMAADGSMPVDLSNPAVNDCTPSYSSDGRMIAFERGNDCVTSGSSVITVMNADGSNQRQVTTPPAGGNDGQARFSPDGKQLVFERSDGSGNELLFVVNVDGTGEHQLLTPPAGFADETPRWSPDGTKIAFMREPANDSGGRIMLVSSNGTGTATALTTPPANYKDGDPSFSPDGSRIAFGRSPVDGSSGNSDVLVINANGTGETNLTNEATTTNENADPSFSPDGKLILYGRFDAGANTEQIYAMNPDGAGKHAITLALAGQSDYEPDWGVPAQAPVLSGLGVGPSKASIAGRKVKGKCVAQTKKNKKRKKCSRSINLIVRYTLDFPSAVALNLTRALPGRKVKGKCVAQTKKNKKRKRCTRTSLVASLAGSGAAGANTFTLDAKKLGAGSYVLTATPSAVGLTGAAQTATFKILR